MLRGDWHMGIQGKWQVSTLGMSVKASQASGIEIGQELNTTRVCIVFVRCFVTRERERVSRICIVGARIYILCLLVFGCVTGTRQSLAVSDRSQLTLLQRQNLKHPQMSVGCNFSHTSRASHSATSLPHSQ